MRNAECRIAEFVGGLGGAVLIATFRWAEILFPLTLVLSPGERGYIWLRLRRAGRARKMGGTGSIEKRNLSLLISAAPGIGELEELGGLVLKQPVAVAALFPFGKVLLGDGTVFEVSGEDGFDFGE